MAEFRLRRRYVSSASGSPRIFAIVPLLLLGAFLAQGICSAQVFSSAMDYEALDGHLSTFKGAANEWRTKPVELSAQVDTASGDIRLARDRYWDESIGSEGSLLDPTTATRIFPNLSTEGDFLLSLHPEFPADPNLVWVIGHFDAYHSYFSASEKSIYTEMNFKVQQVFGQAVAMSWVKSGTTIDLGSPGGTVVTPNRVVLSYALGPRRLSLVPGGTYLLQLDFHHKEQFFSVRNQWDLSVGRAVPLTGLEEARQSSGSSILSGMAIDDILKTLRLKYNLAPE